MWLYETLLLERALGRLGSLRFTWYLPPCNQVWFIIITPYGGLLSQGTKYLQYGRTCAANREHQNCSCALIQTLDLSRLILMIIHTRKLLTSKTYCTERKIFYMTLQYAKTLKAPNNPIRNEKNKLIGSMECFLGHWFLQHLPPFQPPFIPGNGPRDKDVWSAKEWGDVFIREGIDSWICWFLWFLLVFEFDRFVLFLICLMRFGDVWWCLLIWWGLISDELILSVWWIQRLTEICQDEAFFPPESQRYRKVMTNWSLCYELWKIEKWASHCRTYGFVWK